MTKNGMFTISYLYAEHVVVACDHSFIQLDMNVTIYIATLNKRC